MQADQKPVVYKFKDSSRYEWQIDYKRSDPSGDGVDVEIVYRVRRETPNGALGHVYHGSVSVYQHAAHCLILRCIIADLMGYIQAFALDAIADVSSRTEEK